MTARRQLGHQLPRGGLRFDELLDQMRAVGRAAREADVSGKNLPKAATAVAMVLARRLTPGQLNKTLEQLPPPIKDLVNPWPQT